MNDNRLILVVEDSEDDFFFIQRAFSKAHCKNPIKHFVNGQSALKYLKREDEFSNPSDSPRPGVILLDLNMPGISGKEVLEVLKHDDELKKIPVIVLTTSEDPHDIEECYKNGANSYIVKPVGFEKYVEAVKALQGYWIEVSVLPKQS